jgi:hypothetical protein
MNHEPTPNAGEEEKQVEVGAGGKRDAGDPHRLSSAVELGGIQYSDTVAERHRRYPLAHEGDER